MLHSMVTLAKLLLVMPATNAESEQIFSAMTKVKTYMRSTTSDNRLNHLMTLHVHKEELDNVDKVHSLRFFHSIVKSLRFLHSIVKTHYDFYILQLRRFYDSIEKLLNFYQ